MLLFSLGWAIPRPVFPGFLGSLTNDDATTTPTKKWLIFTSEICERLDLFSTLMALKLCSGLICFDSVHSQFQMEMRKISLRRPRSVEGTELGHFTLLSVSQRTAKKCTKRYNAREQLFLLIVQHGRTAVRLSAKCFTQRKSWEISTFPLSEEEIIAN